MKKSRIAIIITAAMAFSSMPVYAENTKHERVYVVADPAGQVQTLIDNIRLENKDGLDEIEDRSMLTDIENVGGKESFAQDGEKIIWQAEGNDITYQGTSDQELPVIPVVRVMVDGKEVGADALKDLNGRITLEVSYQTSKDAPALAASVIPLPSEGVSDIEMTDAWLLSESGVQCIAGWGVTGIEMEEAVGTEETETAAEEDAETSAKSGSTEAEMAEEAAEETEVVEAGSAETEADEDSAEEEGTEAEISEKETVEKLLTEEGSVSDSFSVSFNADHVDLSWMYTIVSAEPMMALSELSEENADGALSFDQEEIEKMLTALSDGEELPETTGSMQEAGEKINELNQGLTDLDDGAVQIADGAKALSDGAGSAADGAKELSTGLETLSSNNQALQDGMSAMLDAVLATANEQIAASDLSKAGITVPELTQENYREVLEGLLEQFSPEGVENAVREQVRSQVEENRDQIEAAVDEEVKKKVLEAILDTMNMKMTVEEYNAAVDSGDVSSIVSAGIKLALDEQMGTEEVQTKRDAAVEEQIEKLVDEHTQEYMDSEEGQGKLASATQAYESLDALCTQLFQIGQLKDGVDEYTNGVAQASAGASDLSDGMEQLRSGAADLSAGTQDLSEGVSTLHTSLTDAQKQAADALLPYMESRLAGFIEGAVNAAGNSENGGYDLRPDGMKTVTSFIIRTDF